MNYSEIETEETVKVIVKGQPWELPAHLSEAQITARLNTNDWDYAMPDKAPLTVNAKSIAHYLN